LILRAARPSFRPFSLSIPATALVVLMAACGPAPTVHEHTGFVMGTIAQLKLGGGDARAAAAALDRALVELTRIEALTTTHAEASEVSRLNRADGAWTPVGRDVDSVLQLAFFVRGRSRLAFDPLAGSFVRLWGFPDEPALPDSAAIEAIRRSSSELERRAATGTGAAGEWRITPVGREVDLGGIAKGYGVDRAVGLLVGQGSGCLINVGGDLAVRGKRPDGKSWLIGVQDPRDPSRLFVKLRLEGERAVATSGDYQRFFDVGGARYHHILDPRTGWPARGTRSATVIASTCALADAWATAAFVLGPAEGVAALEAEPGIEGVLVTESEAGDLVLHATSGFDAYRAE
jgi:thiamine biosynthesis lipoprotein